MKKYEGMFNVCLARLDQSLINDLCGRTTNTPINIVCDVEGVPAGTDDFTLTNFREVNHAIVADLELNENGTYGRVFDALLRSGAEMVTCMVGSIDNVTGKYVGISGVVLQLVSAKPVAVSAMHRLRIGDYISMDTARSVPPSTLFQFLQFQGVTRGVCQALVSAITDDLAANKVGTIFVDGDRQLYYTPEHNTVYNRFMTRSINPHFIINALGIREESVKKHPEHIGEIPDEDVDVDNMNIAQLGAHIHRLKGRRAYCKRRSEELKVEINNIYDKLTKAIDTHVNKLS